MKKSLSFLGLAAMAAALSNCSSTTVVKPEPTTVESVRRTSTSSYSAPGMLTPSVSSTTETRSVTAQ